MPELKVENLDAFSTGAIFRIGSKGRECLHTVFAAAVVAFVLVSSPIASAEEWGNPFQPPTRWIEVWSASPEQPINPIGSQVVPPLTLDGQTIRQIARVSTGAHTVRLRLSNEFTDAPTVVGAVHVALSKANGTASSAIVTSSDRVVTFNGELSVTLRRNAPALSDPIELPVAALGSLAVSIYVSSSAQYVTDHFLGVQTGYIVPGNQTGAPSLGTTATTTTGRYILSGIDAEVADGATIAVVGDSITDSYCSTIDADKRWPDVLANRLQSAGLQNLGVANDGIGGGRVLMDDYGPSALNRFDRDVLARPGVRDVIVFEGINDIGAPIVLANDGPIINAADLISGYQQLIVRAHERGIRIFGATITPFGGATTFTSGGETTREAVNNWIRMSHAYDGFFDFDAAVRDPSKPTQLLPIYDCGDHLHSTNAGYQKMAQTVDLHAFTEFERR